MKAKECDECKYHYYEGLCSEKLICEKGHKPRFYLPKHRYPYGDYGWKRRCDDFKESIPDDVG